MKEPTPRNVIWITTDHMRFDNIRAHGNPLMMTPNMDRLVEHGVTFTNCFVQNPVCVPSRCSFMTGLYPQQTGVTWNGHCLPPDFYPTVARVFGEAGYQTTQIGKLHFQPHEDNDLEATPRHKYGLDIMMSAEEPGCYEDAYMTWLRTEYPQHVRDYRVARLSSPKRFRNQPGQPIAKVVDAPWQASFSGWIATMASNFLSYRSRRDPAHRHFMHLGFYAPHPPLNLSREMFEPYQNVEIAPPPQVDPSQAILSQTVDHWSDEDFVEYKRHFCAMVTGVDMALGQILSTLEESNQLDDTLIILSSDHGDMCGDLRMLQKGATKFYDPVTRVPCVLHWPNGLGSESRKVEGLIEKIDVLPTLLELCNGYVPSMMMGNSYARALLENKQPEVREDVLCYSNPPVAAMLRTDDFKYCRLVDRNREVLFDLKNDPSETTDVSEEHPGITATLRDRLLDRMLVAGRSHLKHHYLF